MHWTERETDTNKPLTVTTDRAAELEKSKAEGQPVVEREAERGQVPFNGIRFQPVKSPGLYEAEFAQRGSDIIFHFWPYGFHSAQRRGLASAPFPKGFAEKLAAEMSREFGPSASSSFDREMGAYFVRVVGWGEKQFFRELALAVCEKLHLSLGGEAGRSDG